MTKEQRIAISRVISDMIKADNIIEETEIQDMKQLMSDYSLTRQDMEAAQNIKLSDAIPVLRVLPKKVREELVNKIYGIAQSDNVCVPREALLLIALKYCLLDEEKKQKDGKPLPKPYLVSCATGEATLNDQYMVYIESKFDKGMNDEKFQSVVEGIIECLPAPVKLFVNENTIKLFVQTVFDSIKSALDVQPKIDSKTSEDTEEGIEEEE